VAGVLACATFGTAPPVAMRAAWRAACADHGLPLVIDSAPGFGAVDADGGRLGGLGDTEVFSFHATKPLAVGEGGAILTADRDVAARAERLVNFGLDPHRRTSEEAGLNAKLSELQAATALAALDALPHVLAARRRFAAALQAATAGCGLVFQRGAAGSTWQYFQALAPDEATRRSALEAARELGVEARTLHDPPLHRHPAFADAPRHGALPVTEALARRSLSLPLANALSDEELARIAAVVRRAAGREGAGC
jgi:dTDP-4-amino-4,6-dideoxygalactose transaminase